MPPRAGGGDHGRQTSSEEHVMRVRAAAIGVALAAAVIAAVWGGVLTLHTKEPARSPEPVVNAPPGPGDMVVYKSPTCGCCGDWIEHVRAAGFRVIARDTSDVGAVKRRLGVLPTLESCHTATISGYVIEGHVPADAIVRLLEERPSVVGLAVPGMPAGSPGMESARPHVSYEVIAFDKEGRTQVFARY
jgi:hypothetical protein